MNSLAEIEFRYRNKIFLVDDLGKKYVLFFNQETQDEIMNLIGRFKTSKISITGKQEKSYPITIGNRIFQVLQQPYIYTLNLWNFYQFGLTRNRDWYMLSKADYEQITKTKRKKLIKKRKHHGK